MTSQLSLSTYFALVKLLTTCLHGCPDIAKTLLSGGILDTLRIQLATSAMASGSGGSSSSVVRSADQLHAVLLLATELMPGVPDAPSALQKGLPLTSLPAAPAAAAAAEGGSACERSRILAEDAPLTARFSSELLPLLMQVYASSVMPQVCGGAMPCGCIPRGGKQQLSVQMSVVSLCLRDWYVPNPLPYG